MPYEVSWKNSQHTRKGIIFKTQTLILYIYIKVKYTIEILISDWKILRYVIDDSFKFFETGIFENGNA